MPLLTSTRTSNPMQIEEYSSFLVLCLVLRVVEKKCTSARKCNQRSLLVVVMFVGLLGCHVSWVLIACFSEIGGRKKGRLFFKWRDDAGNCCLCSYRCEHQQGSPLRSFMAAISIICTTPGCRYQALPLKRVLILYAGFTRITEAVRRSI